MKVSDSYSSKTTCSASLRVNITKEGNNYEGTSYMLPFPL